MLVSRMRLESAAAEGESPVGEASIRLVVS